MSQEELQEQLAENPSSWQVRNALIQQILHDGEESEEAKSQALEVLNSATEAPVGGEELEATIAAYQCLDPEGGSSIMDTLLEYDEENALAYLGKAKMALALGNEEEAIEFYRKAKSRDIEIEDDSISSIIKSTRKNVIDAEKVKAAQEAENLPKLKAPIKPDLIQNLQGQIGAEFGEDEGIVYPNPGEFPTIPVSKIVKIAPLVDPNALPGTQVLQFEEEVIYKNVNFTPKEKLKENLQDVNVVVKDKKVVMDYENPEKVLPERNPDALQVAADHDEAGHKVAPAPAAMLDFDERKRQDQRRKREGRFKAFTVAGILHVVAGLIFAAITWAIPTEKEPPIITAIAPPNAVEDAVKKQTITENVQQKPSSNMPSPPIISSTSASDFVVPDVVTSNEFTPSVGIEGVDLGANSFATESSANAAIFGEPITGSLGVIFDISTSTQEYLPNVIEEIRKGFKDAYIISVQSAAIREVKEVEVVPFKAANHRNSYVMDYWNEKIKQKHRAVPIYRMVEKLLKEWKNSYVDSRKARGSNIGLGIQFLLQRGINNIYIFSDFEDKTEIKEMERLTKLCKKSNTKIYMHTLGDLSSNKKVPKTAIRAYKDMVIQTDGRLIRGKIRPVRKLPK